MKKPQYVFEVACDSYMEQEHHFFATLEDATRYAIAHNKAHPLGVEEYDPQGFVSIKVHMIKGKEQITRQEQWASEKQKTQIEIIDDKAS